jgi:hypothetical protein
MYKKRLNGFDFSDVYHVNRINFIYLAALYRLSLSFRGGVFVLIRFKSTKCCGVLLLEIKEVMNGHKKVRNESCCKGE